MNESNVMIIDAYVYVLLKLEMACVSYVIKINLDYERTTIGR